MKDVAFGQYYPTNSPIHKLDARAKILFTFVFIIFIFFVESYVGYAAVALFILATALIGRIPIRSLFKSIKAILFLMIFISILNVLTYKKGTPIAQWWIITITWQGIDFAVKIALRLVLLVMGASLLTFTTTPMEMTDGIESLLKPLKYIKVPVHDIALIMSISLRMIPNLMDETDKIIMAQKARGGSFDTGGLIAKLKAMIPVLIPLFTSAFRISAELADALDARCYSATPNRTKMKVLKFSYRDAVALLILAALLTFICLDKWYWKGIDGHIVAWIRSMSA